LGRAPRPGATAALRMPGTAAAPPVTEHRSRDPLGPVGRDEQEALR